MKRLSKTLVLSLVLLMMVGAVAMATTLRTTITATPESLDPAVTSGENDWKVAVNLYDFLVYPSFEDASPEASVAASWDVSDDSLTWTFYLNEGVTFHDGSELTASDVKFSMDRMIGIGEGYAYFFADRVAETRVVDDYTVVFELSEPFGPFLVTLYRLAIVNEDLVMANLEDGMYGDYGDYGKGYLLTSDAGSGPYTASDFRIRNYVQMSKYDNYWQGVSETAPDVVIANEVLDAATTKMMMGSDEIDLAHGRQEMTTLNSLAQMDDVGVAFFPEMSVNFFMINTKKAPTDDIHFRRAMAYATDYSAMMAIYPDSPRALGPVPSHVFGYADDLVGYEYNLELARQELALSPYADQLSQYPIDVSYIQGNGDTAKLCLQFAANMAQIGITANLVEKPWVLFCNQEETIETSPHVTNLFANCSYPEAGAILELKYASWTVGGWNQNEWLQDSEFDAMITEALVTVDADARAALYSSMQYHLVDELCPSIYTFVSVLKAAYRSDVFSWPAGEGSPHAIAEFNFNYRFFEMI